MSITMNDEAKLAETPAEQPTSLDEVSTETKVETQETKAEEGETKEAGETAGEVEPKKPSGAQRAKAKEARLQAELQQRDREIEELRSRVPGEKSSAATESKEPVEADFNGDFFAFQQAATAFKAGKAARDAIREEFQTREQSERKANQAALERQRQDDFNDRVLDLRDTITDLEATLNDGVKNGNKPFSPYVMNEVGGHEKSVELAYYLLKNPARLEALNDITDPVKLAREVGRLEGNLTTPTAKKQTTAPPPLSPLKGGASGSFDPEKASMDDYVAKRKAGWKG